MFVSSGDDVVGLEVGFQTTRREPPTQKNIKTDKTYDESKVKSTNLVRLRFWRASGLLSTSGGRELATVVGECTRKARPAFIGLERLPDDGEEEGAGAGDEPDMMLGSRKRVQQRRENSKEKYQRPSIGIRGKMGMWEQYGGRECVVTARSIASRPGAGTEHRELMSCSSALPDGESGCPCTELCRVMNRASNTPGVLIKGNRCAN